MDCEEEVSKRFWHVTGKVTITVTTLVEADNADEAREQASARDMSGSWRDDGNNSFEWLHDDLDGEPVIVAVMEVVP